MEKGVRPASIDDIAEIMPLLSSVAQLHGENRNDIFRTPTLHYTESQLRQLMTGGELTAFVSYDGEKITGVLLSRLRTIRDHDVLRDSTVLWIEDTCIGEAYRKRGYGKMLLDHAKEFARSNGCSRMELNVWSFNRNARDFFASQGMKEQRATMEFIL